MVRRAVGPGPLAAVQPGWANLTPCLLLLHGLGCARGGAGRAVARDICLRFSVANSFDQQQQQHQPFAPDAAVPPGRLRIAGRLRPPRAPTPRRAPTQVPIRRRAPIRHPAAIPRRADTTPTPASSAAIRRRTPSRRAPACRPARMTPTPPPPPRMRPTHRVATARRRPLMRRRSRYEAVARATHAPQRAC